VDLDVTVTNSARDHRLRVLFPSGARGADEYRVEQAFGYVVRPVRLPDSAGWREKQPATGPQKAWVHVADACQGLAVLNVGLPECEVMDDVDRTIAITLLRCTGQGVGLPEEQTDGQMIGRHSFRLAVLPCSGGAPQTEVWRQAHALNVPMRAIQTGLHAGRVGDGHSFVTVAPDTLVVSALKRSESGESVVLRAYSVDDEPVESEIGLHWPDAQGTGRPVWAGDPAARPGLRRARLDEEAIAPSMMVLPHEIATFMADGPDTGR
jgi:alpha-mannosidase